MTGGRRLATWWVAALLAAGTLAAQPRELRGWWVDTFHPALRTPAEVDALVAQARAANFNALFVEVRKRGDAYYHSRYEPRATDVQAGFDPLGYLLQRAHNAALGPRLEVHAWIVTYIIWNSRTALPAQPNHPFRLHPDWLTESFAGEQWDGANFAFDPGHPAVQEHTFNVAMDLISRYDVDGFHFDYIRYGGRDWGYNPVAVARFNAMTGSSGRPAPDDSWWLQWRRDQVTALLRRVYLAASVQRPGLKISAATITWTPAATTFPAWLRSSAWSSVLQDWRSWMAEGILDLNIPMAYFRQETHAAAWADWSRFARQHRYQRHVALGVGAYLNTISNSIAQMRTTRVSQGPAAPRADGVVAFSYAVPAKDGVPRADFITALTSPTAHDPVQPPIFAEPVPTPPMPWKTDGSLLGLVGRMTDATTGQPLAGAQIEACGVAERCWITDPNGAFASLLPLRPAALVVSAPGYLTRFIEWPAGVSLLHTNLALSPDTSDLRPLDLRVAAGRDGVVVSWRTAAPARGAVLCGPAGLCETREVGEPRFDTRHSVMLGRLDWAADPAPAEFRLRVVNEAPDGARHVSHAVFAAPARRPLEAGPWDARRTGSWSFNQTGGGEPPAGYWSVTTTTGEPGATARWRVTVEVPGAYDLEYWLPANVGAAGVTYEIRTRRATRTVRVNQSQAVSGYRLLAANLWLERGEQPEVRLANQTGTAGQSLAVGAIRWVYRDGQDPPPAPALPAWWAEHFFAGAADPDADPDGDGLSNRAEFAFGTDPLHAHSRLRLRLDPAPDGAWRMRISPVVTGRRYTLERATRLDSPDWQAVAETPGVPAPDGEGALEDPEPRLEQGFYRLRVELD